MKNQDLKKGVKVSFTNGNSNEHITGEIIRLEPRVKGVVPYMDYFVIKETYGDEGQHHTTHRRTKECLTIIQNQ